MPDPRRIVMFGELLRTESNNAFHGDRVAKCLHELFRRQIEAATGLPVHLELAGDGNLFDRKRFYHCCGIDSPSTEGWLRLMACPCPAEAAAYFAECFGDAFVICHEADSLLPVMDMAGIPYVDMRVAPIRFLPDLHLAFRTNMPAIRDRLGRYIMPEEHIYCHAGRVKARHIAAFAPARVAARCPIAGLEADSLLVCGQIDMDLSLLRKGRVTLLEECADALDDLAARHGAVYFKPHPYARKGGKTAEFIRSRPTIRHTDQNIYRLLSDDNLKTVAAISSGVLSEAPYFGKAVLALSHRYVRLASAPDAIEQDEYVMTTDAYHSPHFWRDILAPCMQTRDCSGPVLPGEANLLRHTLGMWWGYDHGRTAPSPAPLPLRLMKGIADFLDPSHNIRSRLDPKGQWRHRLKNRFH